MRHEFLIKTGVTLLWSAATAAAAFGQVSGNSLTHQTEPYRLTVQFLLLDGQSVRLGLVGQAVSGELSERRLGGRGRPVAGGERQRLASARALSTDPRVLILDEATASVDASTEREIQAALAAVMQGRTTLVIAHRLSTVALADELVVLEGGRVVARGTHDDLYETSDTYREIHDGGLVRPDLIAGDA